MLQGLMMSRMGQEEEDHSENTELGKPSDDDEPGWVMGTITNTVQHRMERILQKRMRPDELTQLGWGDAVNILCKGDMKYGTAEWMVPALSSLKQP
jgi:hypothetical protein